MMKKLNKKDYLRIYTNMLEIRRFEERAAQLFGMGHVGGFCHLYIGQEAVVIGVLMTIDKNDCVVTTYRDHGHMIARGLISQDSPIIFLVLRYNAFRGEMLHRESASSIG